MTHPLSKALPALGLLVLAMAPLPSLAQGAYTIRSLDTALPDFVTKGNSVTVRIGAPTFPLVVRSALTLDGRNVTSALRPDVATATMTGAIGGLKAGVNRLQLFAGKTAQTPVAELKIIVATLPAMACTALLAQGLPAMFAAGISTNSVLTSAVVNADGATSAAGVALPEHCVISGTLEPRVGVPANRPYGTMFELRLPTLWNGRFLFQGQGGTGGSVVAATGQSQMPAGNPPPLAAGWAVVSFDGGHQGGDTQFGLDAKAKTDFAYHSMDIAATAAKSLVAAYYGRPPDRSYFSGTSNGGRQGMMFSQRFPHHFDGIVAGSATYRLSATYADSPWLLMQLNSIAPRNANGEPIMANAYTDADLSILANDILAACDARDGLVDSLVLNTNACNWTDYDPARLQCPGAKTPTCLTPGQVAVMRAIQGGARDSHGRQLYNTWPWDAGIAGPQWRQWKLGSSQTGTPNSVKYNFCSTSVGYLYLTPPEPNFDCLAFNFDVDPARLAENAWLDADNPDITAFRDRGGKILWYHGTADPSTPYTEIVRYLERMTARTAGTSEQAAAFARLFVAPGLGHSTGGTGLDRFDPLTPMVNWVENGVAPERIVATSTRLPGVTRPLCVWPKTPFYAGGNEQDAASFTCR